jgi:hypothetical protein
VNQSLLYELNQVMPDAVQLGLFASVANFYDRPGGATATTDPLGQVDLSNADLVPVAGLQGIACMFTPERPNMPDPNAGTRWNDGFTEEPKRHLLLDDYYPGVLQRYVVRIVEVIGQPAVLYELTPGAVEHDSQGQMTRCAVKAYRA